MSALLTRSRHIQIRPPTLHLKNGSWPRRPGSGRKKNECTARKLVKDMTLVRRSNGEKVTTGMLCPLMPHIDFLDALQVQLHVCKDHSTSLVIGRSAAFTKFS